MTESEYTNEQLIDFMYDVMDWRDVVDHPMIYAVIEALKERHAYRAIGTVEGYKRAVEMSKENYLLYAEYKKKVESFESIGTIERFRELTEKAEPKKPRWHGHHFCPNCNSIVYVNCGKDM